MEMVSDAELELHCDDSDGVADGVAVVVVV